MRTTRGGCLRRSFVPLGTLVALACLHALTAEALGVAGELPRIKVSTNGRFLLTECDTPFFWLADTGWWMTGISPAEVNLYLEKRAQQGFNVIQFHCGRLVKDYAGRLPFRGDDALAPNEEYWRNVDSIVSKAGDHGYALFYTPLGRSFSVHLDRLDWRDATLTWFDPRSGQRTPAGEVSASAVHEFDAPNEPGDGNDWVLVLERRG